MVTTSHSEPPTEEEEEEEKEEEKEEEEKEEEENKEENKERTGSKLNTAGCYTSHLILPSCDAAVSSGCG